MIKDLLEPSALPDHTKQVTCVQTHISMVFIGDSYVYKIKKPVDFGFLDFSSLDKRLYYCEQEIKLNQRLSEGIYLEVLPVTFDGKRHRISGNSGKTVEYAVRMRRIPDESLMKSLFDKNALQKAHMEETAGLLARFHQNAERSEFIDKFGSMEGFKVNTDENFAQTEDFIGRTIEKDDYEKIKSWTESFFKKNVELFEDRISNEKIRDCHGDLHMEHICFLDPVAAIDCIEFNQRFRYSDTLADIAFLLMDLEVHGGREPAGFLWQEYARLTEERGMEELLTFYKVYRAYVRGKVIGFQLNDPNIDTMTKEKASKTAASYFQLARDYIDII